MESEKVHHSGEQNLIVMLSLFKTGGMIKNYVIEYYTKELLKNINLDTNLCLIRNYHKILKQS